MSDSKTDQVCPRNNDPEKQLVVSSHATDDTAEEYMNSLNQFAKKSSGKKLIIDLLGEPD